MRQSRSFWEARVAELAGGGSVEGVALRHGVRPKRLRWWRWRLGAGPGRGAASTRMIEIVPKPSPALVAGLRIVAGDVVLELPMETPPEYVGRILGAARSAC
jgi:transposase-like protein